MLLLLILVVDQQLLDPAVDLFLGLSLEPDALAPFQESLDLVQIQLLGFVHADGQSSACHLQALLALESGPRFRLILCWIRLDCSNMEEVCRMLLNSEVTATLASWMLTRTARLSFQTALVSSWNNL